MDRVEYHPIVIQDLVNFHKNEELNLNPWYQRRSVWTRPQKAYLINTIFEKKPVPSLYIRHSIDLEKEKSIKEVVDGQQRIRSILEYVDGEYSARHPEHASRVKYGDLSPTQRSDFRLTALSAGTLIGSTESDVIEIFGRLNSVAKTLNPQEKRNAKWSGEFKQFCLRQASSRLPIWRDLGIFSATDISRMTEVQFVSDLALNMIQGLTDYSAAKLNRIYKDNDEAFPEREHVLKRMDGVFSQIAALPPESIQDTIFSRSPIFFSLFIVLDSLKKKVSTAKLESALYSIDENFNSDTPITERTKKEAEFYAACTASTQRIKSRRIRDEYIRSYL